MSSETRSMTVPVAAGEIPVEVAGPELGSAEAGARPALLCIPSIFGGNADLLAQMASLSDVGVTAVMDPFWRVHPGPIPYGDREPAFGRMQDLDRAACLADVEAVARWLAEGTNGSVAGLGICFGGPFVLLGLSAGWLQAGVTWHGSRMEGVLERIDARSITGPMRLHYGDADPITPPEAIEAVRSAFADHPDLSIVVHPGADHGFSHEGDAWDEAAAEAGMADARSVLDALAG